MQEVRRGNDIAYWHEKEQEDMSRTKPRKRYYVSESKKGGVRQRRGGGSTGDKQHAEGFLKAMRKQFGGQFNYKLRWEWV